MTGTFGLFLLAVACVAFALAADIAQLILRVAAIL
jgi:hypothetical protein